MFIRNMFPCILRRPFLVSATCLLLTGFQGCSRSFWRDQADRDAYLAITEKLNDPRWQLPRIDVNADPRSRFYDPYDPDAEPAPPDDSAAAVYMNWVDGWQGYKGWHKFGDVMTVENPQWLENFGISAENVDALTGEVMGSLPELKNVTLPQAVELAQINNRDYQTEIEDVYLAALAVTYQRFQFGVRYLGVSGVEPGANTTATFVPHGPGDRVAAGMGAGVSQLLPAGTQWAVEFANNTIWLFSGGNQTQTMSNLSFSIVQPLLFGAGRKVGLEGLTQTERNLLYQARVLARVRQQIFTNVVGGSSGFLQLLYELQQIRNLKGNIGRLEEQIEKLLSQTARNKLFASADLEEWPADVPPPENLPAPLQNRLRFDPQIRRLYWSALEVVSDEEIQALRNLSPDPGFREAASQLIEILQSDVATLDVLTLQSSLASNTNDLRNLERGLQDDLDSFKIYLGLRTDMIFSIDSKMLKLFELIDPQLSTHEQQAKDFVDQWGALDEEHLQLEQLRRLYVEFLALVDEVSAKGMRVVIDDLARAKQELPRRLQEIPEEDRPLLISDVERAGALLDRVEEEMVKLRESVVETAQGLRESNLDPVLIRAKYKELGALREKLVGFTQNLTVIQISLRVELIQIQPFDIAQQLAVEIGVNNRVDLMNQRAIVMDARRKVEIAANALLSSVDIVVAGDINTPTARKPFDFRGERSQLRAGISFTSPLDQIDERNNYRLTLINYQRQRRAYMLAEDEVKQDIRNAWRQLFVLRQNLETSRRAVRIAALQYDAAVDQSNAPPDNRTIQGASSGKSSGSGLAGNNLLNALSSILRAQNNLVSTYMNYERNRLNIYRDMGIMEIGEDGMWVDPFYRRQVDESRDEQIRPNFDMDFIVPPAAGAGRSRLGGGNLDSGLVVLPDKIGSIPRRTEKSHSGDSPIRSVSRQSEHAGFSR